MQRLSDLTQLHDELMKDPKYRRLYEFDQQSKAYEERKNLLRDLAKMVDTIGYDRLAELVDAERDGRVVVLPTVSARDHKIFTDGLDDVFREWAIYDRSVGLSGMTEGEAKLAYAILDVLQRAEAEAKGGQE